MTDWQPLWATLVAHASGVSTIHETVMQSRFQYAAILQQMGARLEFFQPPTTDLEATYNFNLDDDQPQAKHALKIFGPTNFHGGCFKVPDLRAGATIILAALSSPETTILTNIVQVDRGYEQLDVRLRQLGARIKRVVD
jgi:UDP-N-acetylglucosamine 1-carboxyvinyltransferase